MQGTGKSTTNVDQDFEELHRRLLSMLVYEFVYYMSRPTIKLNNDMKGINPCSKWCQMRVPEIKGLTKSLMVF